MIKCEIVFFMKIYGLVISMNNDDDVKDHRDNCAQGLQPMECYDVSTRIYIRHRHHATDRNCHLIRLMFIVLGVSFVFALLVFLVFFVLLVFFMFLLLFLLLSLHHTFCIRLLTRHTNTPYQVQIQQNQQTKIRQQN